MGLFEHSRLCLLEKSEKIFENLNKKRIKTAIFHFPQFEHEPF